MGKLAGIVAAGAPRTGHWCEVCELLESMDTETREEAKAMLIDAAWKPSTISAAWSDALGTTISTTVIDVHRKSRARG